MLLGTLVLQREYEEFKIRINALVSKAQKVPEEGWVMQDGTPWPGNNTRDHPGMIQVTSVPPHRLLWLCQTGPSVFSVLDITLCHA